MKKVVDMNEAINKFEQRTKGVPGPRVGDTAQALSTTKVEEMIERANEMLANDLKDRLSRLVSFKGEFGVGHLVVWKPGLCNRINLPESAKLMIVTEVFDEPMFETSDQVPLAAIGQREPLDLRVGIIVGNPSNPGQLDFIELLIDSRRVELWNQ